MRHNYTDLAMKKESVDKDNAKGITSRIKIWRREPNGTMQNKMVPSNITSTNRLETEQERRDGKHVTHQFT
jgi:hypothetical protein